VQRAILQIVLDGRLRTIRDLTIEVYENPIVVLRAPPTRSQEVAVRRAVRDLVEQGRVRRVEGLPAGIFVGRACRVSDVSHDRAPVTAAEITGKFNRLLEAIESQASRP
jgi:hypothetical protein